MVEAGNERDFLIVKGYIVCYWTWSLFSDPDSLVQLLFRLFYSLLDAKLFSMHFYHVCRKTTDTFKSLYTTLICSSEEALSVS